MLGTELQTAHLPVIHKDCCIVALYLHSDLSSVFVTFYHHTVQVAKCAHLYVCKTTYTQCKLHVMEGGSSVVCTFEMHLISLQYTVKQNRNTIYLHYV